MMACQPVKVNMCWHTLVGMKKSDRTKAVILAAAREQFAKAGFERATIRAIAADANIDPSMVMRYFGNKNQLFAAAAEFDLQLPDLSDVSRDQLGARLVAHFLERWERDEALVVLLRSSMTNDEAAQRMRKIFSSQLRPVVAIVNADDAPRRAGLIATQVLGLALCRYILRLPPIAAMSRQDVVAWLGPTVQRYLDGPQLSAVMWNPTLVLIAITTLAACATLGGGLYEFLVVDPFWPKRPGIIQARNGGISRARFWVPAHTTFEALLIVTLVVAWSHADVRVALVVALISHAVMRVWSLVDFVPKALAFEKADPATVDEAAAVRWTRRSLLRLPLALITCGAMLVALAGYS
jgi:AcrR family transcriptional regulator